MNRPRISRQQFASGLRVTLAVFAFAVPTLLLVSAGFGWLGIVPSIDGTILLAAACTSFFAVTEIASRPELAEGDGTTRDSYWLTAELFFFGSAMGYSLHKSGISSDFNMWFVFSIVLFVLCASPYFSDRARLGILSWALAIATTLYLTAGLFPLLQREVLARLLDPHTLSWLRPRYGAYLHLLIIPAFYLLFDCNLTLRTAKKSRPLDLALLVTGIVCVIIGKRANTQVFELGASAAILLFANSAYYILTIQDPGARPVARHPTWPLISSVHAWFAGEDIQDQPQQ